MAFSSSASDTAHLRNIMWVFALLTILGTGLLLYQLYDQLWSLFKTNEWVQALLVSSFLGGLVYLCGEAYRQITHKVADMYFCSISVENKDEHFDAIINYITEHCDIKKGSLMAQTRKKKKRTWKEWRDEALQGIRKPPQIEFRPRNENDAHIIRHKGCRILLTRAKGDTVTVGWNRKPLQMETLTLSAWGKDNELLKDLILKAVEANYEEDSSEISIFVQSTDFWGGWEKALSKTPRPADSVILDETLAEKLLGDAREFLQSSEWYSKTGIPYRRGYLLYGPPGCGKTSSAEVLAGELKLDIAMLSLSNKDMNDTNLASALREAPKRSIILLEDVDAVFVERKMAQPDGTSPTTGVTFSGLLNAIDGVASQEGRIFFMTTNHIDRLDSALIRPGRCDVKVELRKASRVQMQRIFLRFFPGNDKLALEFSSRIPEFEISMAQLQGHLLESKYSPDTAVKNVAKLLAAPPVPEKMAVFDHLRRIGLEHLTPIFEHFGYYYRTDLGRLNWDQISKWDLSLKHIPQSQVQRLKDLFDEKEAIVSDYQLANLSQIRDMFLATYGPTTAQHHSSTSLDDFSRCGSSGLVQLEAEAEDETQVFALAKQFSDLVTFHGKGIVSVWQLKWHFSLFQHSIEAALANTHLMMQSRKDCPWVPDDVEWLTTQQFWVRMGLPHVANKCHEKGYTVMTQMMHLSKEEVEEEMALTKQQAAAYQAILDGDDKRADILHGIQLVEFQTVFNQLGVYYGRASLEEEKRSFCMKLCNAMGRAAVSLVQLKKYLATNCASINDALTNVDQLNSAVNCDEEPTTNVLCGEAPWVTVWLKSLGMGQYAPRFISQGLVTENDVLTPEPLSEFDEVGVKKWADKRKLTRALKAMEERNKEKEDSSKTKENEATK